ncbi:MAG: hypothetical protein U0V70_01755 [Terriglobia bacterium]
MTSPAAEPTLAKTEAKIEVASSKTDPVVPKTQTEPAVESHVETAPVAPVKQEVTVAQVQPQTVAILQENRTPLAAAPPVPTAEPAPAVVTSPESVASVFACGGISC